MAIYEMQGGRKPARNYLGKQKTVSNVPIKWKSGPNAPSTELAYITEAEKNLLLEKDLHGSLKNGPNTGPDDIMSLDSQGDYTRDRSPSKAEGSQAPGVGGGNSAYMNQQIQKTHDAKMKDILTGQKNIGQTVQTGPRTRQYSNLPEWMKVKQPDGTYKMKHMASAYKDTGDRGFLSRLFSRGAPGYRGLKGLPAWGDPMKNINRRGTITPQGNIVGGEYYTDDENFGEVRDAVPNFGLMGLIQSLKNKFKKPPQDMSQFNTLGAAQTGIPGDSSWEDGTFTWGQPTGTDIVPLEKPLPNADLGNTYNYSSRATGHYPNNINLPNADWTMNQTKGRINANDFRAPFNAPDAITGNYGTGIPPGNMRGMSRADGGRIGYEGGELVGEEFEDENTQEFMRDQGVPFGEMAEGPSPFELRIQELVDTGMSWQEAYQIAAKEFGQIAEGPEDSFSAEGIASIV
jgi:hypothetical protein